MNRIDIFQSDLNRCISLENLGKVKYIGESFGVKSLTDGKLYDVLKDRNGMIKIVDNSGEDYIYDLVNPKPMDESSTRGKFELVEDLSGQLESLFKI